MDDMLEAFLEESREFMSSIEDCLLTIESGGVDSELINEVFRAVHTVKGGSNYLGLAEIGKLSHNLEDVLSKIRNGDITPNSLIINKLLKGIDKLNEMLNSEDQGKSTNMESTLSDLEQILSDEMAAETAPEAVSEIVAEPEPTHLPETPVQPEPSFDSADDESALPVEVAEKADISKNLYRVEVDFKSIRKSVNLKGQKGGLLAFISNIGTILHADIPLEKINKSKTGSASLYIETTHEKEILTSMLGIPDESAEAVDLSVQKTPEKVTTTPTLEIPPTPKKAPPPKPKSEEPKKTPASTLKPVSSKGPSESIRIKVDLLDKIMTLTGEMVLSRNQLTQQYIGRSDNAILLTHSQQVTVLQESVMKTRLQPVSIVFVKFKRVLRDMAQKLGKEINMVLHGEEVELDRSIIDSLSDPLTHLIRNCADHAVETPAEREKAGKQRAGTVKLSAFHEGGHVIIEIEDDGRGIDAEKLKNKCLEKKILTEEEASKMNKKELLNLIFRPGFSTAEKVSDVSGRGVGMDVVKTTFDKLGGLITLDTRLGKGTRISVQLPLTLAIIPSLLVTVGNQRFSVPQVDVVEIVRIKRGEGHRQIEVIQDQSVFRLRGKLLPVVRLSNFLNINRTYIDPETDKVKEEQRDRIVDRRDEELKITSEEASESRDKRGRRKVLEIQRLIVLRHGPNYIGLLVDNVQGPEEIVVKPLPIQIKSCKAFSGVTIMGDGRVAMILDVAGIVALSKFKFETLDEKASEYEEDLKRKTLLEQQSVIVFKNSDEEFFAVPLSLVERVEKFKTSNIESVKKKEFIQLRGKSIKIVRLEDHLDVTPGNRDCEEAFMIIPKIVTHPVGIFASKILDVFETVLNVDRKTVSSPGLLGSCIIDKRMSLMLDMYSLFELAFPEYTKKIKKDHYKILLVEDTPFFRTLVKNYFESSGFRVTVACDGKEGLEILQKTPTAFDIVVSDIEMPVMDGYELVKNIKSSSELNHLPVMALTALTSEENQKKGTRAGFDAYEMKIDKEKLLHRVNEVISWSKEGEI